MKIFQFMKIQAILPLSDLLKGEVEDVEVISPQARREL